MMKWLHSVLFSFELSIFIPHSTHLMILMCPSHRMNFWLMDKLTSASRSKRAKSSLSIFTKSCAQYVDEMAVNPTMSAYKML